MTYYNGNPYKEEVTAWAHDDCLPNDQFDVMTLTNLSGESWEHRQQKHPWHWSPIWGAPEACLYCTKAVS